MPKLLCCLLLLAALPLAAEDKDQDKKELAELTRGAVVREGWLDAYEKGDHLYLAIPADRLGRDFVLVPRLHRGIGAGGLYGGLLFERQAASVAAFERHGDRIFLVRRTHRFTAAPGSPEAAALELSIGDSVLQSAPVAAKRPDGAVLIEVTEWFTSDLLNVDRVLRQALGKGPDKPGRASLDRGRSHLVEVKSFPKNLEITARLTFVPDEPSADLTSLPDPRSLALSLHYSLAALPETPMAPRLADERIGSINSVRKDFSRTEETFWVRYANRWRLEPGEPAGNGLVRPKQPIVFYVDRTVPERWRPVLKAGVLAWNRAFEAAGFADAIRAEDLPAGADPDDLRYHTLRWITSDQQQFGAVGPSIVDPRNGEILDADILIEASFILEGREDWRLLTGPAAKQGAAPAEGLERDGFADALAAETALARLAAAGDPEAEERYVEQLMLWVAMHEVGHTLGLDHNFRASISTPNDKLADPAWTREHGIAASVMDYMPANIARGKDGKLGDFYDRGVGDYDRWAISYIYTPEAGRAKEIARLGAQPGHDYGAQDDLDSPGGGLDPSNTIFDLGADPLAWGIERHRQIGSLFPRLPELALREDASYARLTEALQLLFGLQSQTLVPAVKSVGGQYQNRDHVGDPGGRPPFAPVPRATQRRALDFLKKEVFGERSFALPPAVLRQLGSRGWAHWGFEPTYEGGQLDFPWAGQVLNIQRATLEGLTQPLRLAAMRDAELRFAPAERGFTVPELFGELTEAIWSEAWTAPGRSAGPLRRNLQRAYLDRMTGLLLAPPERLPADAAAVARRELRDLEKRLRQRLAPPRPSGGFDAYTEAHLEDALARIEKVLAAQYEMK